jgi:hypothetical protein
MENITEEDKLEICDEGSKYIASLPQHCIKPKNTTIGNDKKILETSTKLQKNWKVDMPEEYTVHSPNYPFSINFPMKYDIDYAGVTKFKKTSSFSPISGVKQTEKNVCTNCGTIKRSGSEYLVCVDCKNTSFDLVPNLQSEHLYDGKRKIAFFTDTESAYADKENPEDYIPFCTESISTEYLSQAPYINKPSASAPSFHFSTNNLLQLVDNKSNSACESLVQKETNTNSQLNKDNRDTQFQGVKVVIPTQKNHFSTLHANNKPNLEKEDPTNNIQHEAEEHELSFQDNIFNFKDYESKDKSYLKTNDFDSPEYDLLNFQVYTTIHKELAKDQKRKDTFKDKEIDIIELLSEQSHEIHNDTETKDLERKELEQQNAVDDLIHYFMEEATKPTMQIEHNSLQRHCSANQEFTQVTQTFEDVFQMLIYQN